VIVLAEEWELFIFAGPQLSLEGDSQCEFDSWLLLNTSIDSSTVSIQMKIGMWHGHPEILPSGWTHWNVILNTWKLGFMEHKTMDVQAIIAYLEMWWSRPRQAVIKEPYSAQTASLGPVVLQLIVSGVLYPAIA
jgi:hypothetical protein